MERTEHHFGQYLAAPSSPGPFGLLLNCLKIKQTGCFERGRLKSGNSKARQHNLGGGEPNHPNFFQGHHAMPHDRTCFSNSVLTLYGFVLAPILSLFKLRFLVLGA